MKYLVLMMIFFLLPRSAFAEPLTLFGHELDPGVVKEGDWGSDPRAEMRQKLFEEGGDWDEDSLGRIEKPSPDQVAVRRIRDSVLDGMKQRYFEKKYLPPKEGGVPGYQAQIISYKEGSADECQVAGDHRRVLGAGFSVSCSFVENDGLELHFSIFKTGTEQPISQIILEVSDDLDEEGEYTFNEPGKRQRVRGMGSLEWE